MTAMSRKFYERLAARYRSERPSEFAPGYDMWVNMVVATTFVISEGNPAFDRAKFMKASGMASIEAKVQAGP
jgi:hypothetical protein